MVSPGKNIHTQNAFMADTFGFYAAAQRCALAAVGGRGTRRRNGKSPKPGKSSKNAVRTHLQLHVEGCLQSDVRSGAVLVRHRGVVNVVIAIGNDIQFIKT